MPGLHRTRSGTSRHRATAEGSPTPPLGPPEDQAQPPNTASSPTAPAPATADAPTPAQVPRTRAGAAWIGICAAALAAVVLIIFMLQNTRTVQINFLWMDGSVPLALALLIAGVGVGIVTMLIGTARLTQLRRLVRDRSQQHRRHPGQAE